MAESLVEFSRDDKKDSSKSKHPSEDKDGKECSPKERPKLPTKAKEESPKPKKPPKCFVCTCDHMTMDCLMRKRLTTMLATKE